MGALRGHSMGEHDAGESRRGFVKKAAYVAPLIVTLGALPSYASYGSITNYKDAAKEAEKAAKEAAKEAAREAKEAAKQAR